MTVTRERSSSAGEPPAKKAKLVDNTASKAETDVTSLFYSKLFDRGKELHDEYARSEPYRHAVVDRLFTDDLLKRVKDECITQLHFTTKETDIYKVNQTGDLRSLSYLPPEQVEAQLPSLLAVRDALYSKKFRQFVREVTGSGALSGEKQDMSVNSYTKGCHLLNHDDVIGTRRVSYILYMPLPYESAWQREWGGSLELYPVKPGTSEPEAIPSKIIPPSWNQFVFFEVQPGKSFHSVEEVLVGADGHHRLSISGWYHEAQPGEEGYEPSSAPDAQFSSRSQLATSHTDFSSYSPADEVLLPNSPLKEEHISYLSEYLNPVYLNVQSLEKLSEKFAEDSSLELHKFMCDPLADKIRAALRERDTNDVLDSARRGGRMPQHQVGVSESWTLQGPPHKWRFLALTESATDSETPDAALLRKLKDEFFPSPAFRAWLALLTSLLPLRYAVEARRFRPGLDYTLATSEENEARLDVVLGLTPDEPKGKSADAVGWESGEWGGWECYLAAHEGDDDPAIYRSGNKQGTGEKEENGRTESSDDITASLNGDDAGSDSDSDSDEEMEADDDGTLLTVRPGFNRLLLVLRDEGVLHFVKYVSAAADGCRWDIYGEVEVGRMEEDDESEEQDDFSKENQY